MDRGPRLAVLGAVVVGLLAVGYVVADAYFLPERATVVDEGEANPSFRAIKAGTFTGTTGHQVSGRVTLIEDGSGYALRFENYRQTQGPDVFVYLTQSDTPDSSREINAGIKVLIDGGADEGESTKEGTFTQPLSGDIDPDQYYGVAIWCDRFSVPFGYAPLEPVG